MAFGPYAGGGGFAPAPMPFMTHLLNAVFNPAAVTAPSMDSTFLSSLGPRHAAPIGGGNADGTETVFDKAPPAPTGTAPSGASMPGAADMIALLQSYSTNPNLQNLLKGYGTDPNVTNMIDQYGTDPTVAALLKQYGIGGGSQLPRGGVLPAGNTLPATHATENVHDTSGQNFQRPGATMHDLSSFPAPPYVTSPTYTHPFPTTNRRWGF